MGKFSDSLQARLRQGSESVMLIGAKSCRSCEHHCKLPNVAAIFCKRFPPQVFTVIAADPRTGAPTSLMQSTYPPVNPDIPCGEYARNKTYADEELREAAVESEARQ